MLETKLDEAIQEANSLPFFGDKRLVIIENAVFLTSAKKTNKIEHNLDLLVAYLDSPLESTVLVILAPYEKLDERKKIVKKIKEKAKIVDVSPLDERALRNFLKNYLANENFAIETDAFEELIKRCDLNLALIMNEIEKLILYKTSSKEIDKKDVEILVSRSLENNIFDLTSYIMQKRFENALILFRDLITQGEEVIRINATIINQIRLFIQVKILLQDNLDQKAIANILKVHPYRVKLAIESVRKISLLDLKNLYQKLIDNDYKFKTGQGDKNLNFEFFILENH
jgi:DNA polymerase-3 subunit delta